MVKAMVNINESGNRILNIVKAKENLRDKSEAINLVLDYYGKELLEPELRPEYLKKLMKIDKEKGIPFKDIDDLRRQIEK